MLKGGLVSIENSLPHLNPAAKKVGEYILKYPQEVVNLSVQKLASIVGVSEATIVRFSRTLQYKGFTDLKLQIAYDLNQAENDHNVYKDISVNGSLHSLIYSVTQNNIQSIRDTFSVLSEKDMEYAIQQISNARKIGVYGVGASAVIARDFKQKITRIDKWCEIGIDFDEQSTISANLNENDVAIGISNSGHTKSIIHSLSTAKEKGATIISLTKFGHNPVSNLADAKLFISSLEENVRSGAMSSRITMLTIIDILFIGIARNNYELSKQKLENTRKAVQFSKSLN